MNNNFYNLLDKFGLYNKIIDNPIEKVNLLYSVPVKVYKVGDNENPELLENYSAETHEKLFNNNPADPAKIDLGNCKRLDFVFDLLCERGICSFDFKSLNSDLKKITFFASNDENDIFSSKEKIIKSESDVSEISFAPEDLCVSARYIHISLVCENNIINVINISANGLNSQINTYRNIIKNKSNYAYVCLENKENYKRSIIDPEENKYYPSWILKENAYFFKKAFNDKPGDVYNVFTGISGKESVNIVVDLNEPCSVNKISAVFGCDREYLPKKLNFYIADSEKELFGKDVKPFKTFEGEFDSGNFEFNFLPRTAKFIRYEIEKGNHPYYGDKILGVISQLKVFGIKAVKNSFADKAVDLSVKFDVKNFKCDDHFGLGTNAWNLPLNDKMSKDSPAYMNDTFFAVEFDRLNRLKPAFIRIPVFIDYFVGSEADYISGNFDFDNDSIKWVFKYFSAAKQAGSEIYLNFCGAKSKDVYDWFAVKNASSDLSLSAPKDPDLYGNAVVAFLKECLKHGFDNIKTIAFYKNINREGFACFGDKRKYYLKTINLISEKLKLEKLDKNFKIVTMSLTGNAFDDNNFKDYIGDKDSELLSTEFYSSHHMIRYLNHFLYKKTAEKYKNMIVNEFSEGAENENGKLRRSNKYWYSQAGQFIEQTRSGFKGSANSFMSGAVKENGKFENKVEDVLFRIPSDTIDGVSPCFKEIALISNYVKMHSGSMASYSSDGNIEKKFGDETDLRACGFVAPGGDITILIENEYDEADRTVYVSLNDYKTREFNKIEFSYYPQFPTLSAEECKIPGFSEKITAVDGRLKIKIPQKHTLTVLTTLPEAKQLNLEKCGFAIKPGEKAELKVAEILGTEDREVEWSVVHGEGTVDQNGVYSAPEKCIPNSFCAVKAMLKSDPNVYNIALINIRE